MTDVKLCGMTRPEDVAAAVALGADFVGVIFAGGPRLLTVERAMTVLDPARGRVKTVGVFGDGRAADVAAMAAALELDVVQLHADPRPADVVAVREAFGGRVWAAARISGAEIGPAAALFNTADAVVLDARVDGALGGTGHTLPWESLAEDVKRLAGRGALAVLAGGLRPENVVTAITAIQPDIVDASSGVESEVGIKDHQRMRTFIAAAHGAAASRTACR